MGYTSTNLCREISGEDYHFAYRSPDKEMVVEMHWNIMPALERFNIDADDLWARTRHEIIAGQKAHVLSPEDLLLHISLHACKEGFFRGLRSLLDISKIIQHYGEGIDWGIIESTTPMEGREGRSSGDEPRSRVVGGFCANFIVEGDQTIRFRRFLFSPGN